MKLLTKEQQESRERAKICYICKENNENKCVKDKTCCKVRDHCHYTGEYIGNAHSICNLKYRVPKKIPIAFHNASNYDYHVVIKELGEEFEKQLTFLGKNTGKYIKKLQVLARIGKSEEEITKNISYRLQFIDSTRFMSSS